MFWNGDATQQAGAKLRRMRVDENKEMWEKPRLSVFSAARDLDTDVAEGTLTHYNGNHLHKSTNEADMGGLRRFQDRPQLLSNLGTQPVSNTPEEFGPFIKSEAEKLGRVIRNAKIAVD